MSQVVTRFPPSPTGPMHIGNVRTGLFSYLLARKNGGRFIFRIEDTDRVRSTKEFENTLRENLAWLGLTYDNTDVWRQSERTEVYKKYLNKLIDTGHAYISKETEGTNPEVVRFKNPNTRITYTDMVRGDITFDTTELGDFIIARNINEPVYHLAVVVDDFESGVTHVVRGDDHISNTPRQILIQEALGAPRPMYVHLPLIVAADRSKLSKRKHGESVSLDYYIKQGFVPAAIINYLALLGWNPGTPEEFFTLSQLEKVFSIEKLQKSAATFDIEKLKWFNRYYMIKMPVDEYWAHAKPFLSDDVIKYFGEGKRGDFLSVALERSSTFAEVGEACAAGEFDYYVRSPEPDSSLIAAKSSPSSAQDVLTRLVGLLDKVDITTWNKDTVKSLIMPYADEAGRSNVLWPLRVALSGRERSPDPFTIAGIIGKDETISRLTNSRSVFER